MTEARTEHTPAAEPGYPADWEADVVASDGGIVHLRPILPSDADALVRMHASLSERTRYLRYFGPYPYISPRDLERFTTVDYHDRVAFICLLGGEIIAVGRYEGLPGPNGKVEAAEVAFVARDTHQGRGLGSILLEHLTAAARENGLRRFEAEVLVENRTMVRVFRDAGYQVSRAFADGVVHLEFDIDPTERSLAVRDSREQRAEARSVHNALHPSSVAVIGASTDPSKIGYAILTNLLRSDFTGPVYPVHPEARSVRGVRAYPSVTDIPDPVDLAVVAVPAAGVDDVLGSCFAKGVRTLVVVSAGFAETGLDGLAAERRLVTAARAQGMRVIGPNALGVANTAPEVRLNATLAPDLPGQGQIGFFAQSGALGIAILAAARKRGLGLSTFVSAGNRADLSGNDLLQYWQTDPTTDLVLLYLETFGNPRKFARVARRLARTKPIVAVKSGRHTSPAAGLVGHSEPIDDASVRALFEQAGVIRVETLAELFDTGLLLAYQPLPAGSRVAVVGNSNALGVLVADALLAEGMQLAGEPIDIGVSASPDEFAAAITAALGSTGGSGGATDPGGGSGAAVAQGAGVGAALGEPGAAAAGPGPAAVAGGDGAAVGGRVPPGGASGPAGADALVAVFVPPIATPGEAYARALRDASAAGNELAAKPVVAVFFAAEGVPAELAVLGEDGTPGRGSVPSYASPERAAAALARVRRYARWRAEPAGDFTPPAGIDGDAARELVARVEAEAAGGRVLTDAEAAELLACYGITLVESRRVADADAAVAAAEELGYPVAVKAVGAQWRHRTDQLGLRLDVVTPIGARRAYTDLTGVSGHGEVDVQRMAPKGVSCVLEIVEDPSFGSLLSFGLAGTASELLGDRAFRVIPLSDRDAAALVRAPRAAPLLDGYRGAEPTDLAAMQDLVRRVGTLAEDLPEV
ncbi:MAG: GNAT family N-acetyltransferase, partial [Pseudonocardia sp.]|nr:GNAT family N-acetyltransferase [Pseudonocardia sp.]